MENKILELELKLKGLEELISILKDVRGVQKVKFDLKCSSIQCYIVIQFLVCSCVNMFNMYLIYLLGSLDFLNWEFRSL